MSGLRFPLLPALDNIDNHFLIVGQYYLMDESLV